MMSDNDNEEISPQERLWCFLDGERVCHADCTAYVNNLNSKVLAGAAGHCVLLVSVERISRFAGGLISIAQKESAERTAPPIPNPRG